MRYIVYQSGTRIFKRKYQKMYEENAILLEKKNKKTKTCSLYILLDKRREKRDPLTSSLC